MRSIIALIRTGARDEGIRRIASSLAVGSDAMRIVYVWHYVRARVRYVRDPEGVELVQSARRTLERGEGDCDDFTILVGALLCALGYPVRVTLVQHAGAVEFNHVVPEVRVGNRWLALDASDKRTKPGVIRGVVRRVLPVGVVICRT